MEQSVEVVEQSAQLKAQFQEQFIQFTNKYCFNPQVGYLIPDDYQIKCFNFEPIKQLLEKFHELNKTGQIVQAADSFPQIALHQPYNFEDMIILHDVTSMIAQSYALQKLKVMKQDQIKLPANIAQPLYISSQYLKCQPGIISGFQYSWKVNHDRYKQDIFDLTSEDVSLKWFFTCQKKEESNFFIINIIGSFYMWKIFREIYFANYLTINAPWWEEQIINRLNKTADIWQKFIEENTKMISLSDDYFYNRLRPYISGFNNLYFQKVDKRLSGNRGNAGFDPSYQLYQVLMGISYKVYNPGFQAVRVQMRTVMAKIHCSSINQMEKVANLRDYCKQSTTLTQAYNNLIIQHVKFTKLHDEFINKYLKKYIPKIQSTPPFCHLLKKADSLEKNMLSICEDQQIQ